MVGDEIIVNIDRLSSSGNGIADLRNRDGFVNIGPVTRDSVGSQVTVRLVTDSGSVYNSEPNNIPEHDRIVEGVLYGSGRPAWGSQDADENVDSANSNISDEYQGDSMNDLPKGYSEVVDYLSDNYAELFDYHEIVTGKIDRISSSRNGILKASGKEINIGPVTEDAVGESVNAGLVDGDMAICLDEGIGIPSYVTGWMKKLGKGTPPPGTEFQIKIKRVNNNGNGMADFGSRTINLGAVKEDIVGQVVPVKMLDNTFAKCLDLSVRASPYKFPGAMNVQYIPEPGKVYSDVIDSINDDGMGVISTGDRHVNIGPVRPDSLGKRVQVAMIDHQFGECLTKEIRGKDYREWLKERKVDSDSEDAWKDESIRQVDLEGPDSGDRSQSAEFDSRPREPDTDRVASSPTNKESVMPDNTELKELREKAEEAATEDPVKDASTTVGSKYIRAPAIKEYAKARADGLCEYCGEFAPFETVAGEPYLEVHHVDELGEGGEDHPDKVVALCPTCHKKIHHGKRGEKINDELQNKLEDRLANAGVQKGS